MPIKVLFLKILHYYKFHWSPIDKQITQFRIEVKVIHLHNESWYKVTFILSVTYINTLGTMQSYWPLESINPRQDKAFKMQLQLDLGFCGA